MASKVKAQSICVEDFFFLSIVTTGTPGPLPFDVATEKWEAPTALARYLTQPRGRGLMTPELGRASGLRARPRVGAPAGAPRRCLERACARPSKVRRRRRRAR